MATAEAIFSKSKITGSSMCEYHLISSASLTSSAHTIKSPNTYFLTTDIDQMKVLEGELQNLAHKFALEIIPIIEASLPLIMDRVMTDLRLELDKQHKCLLLKDSKIKDKDCQ